MQEREKKGFQVDKRQNRGMRRGFELIASLLFIFLLGSGAYAVDMVCSDCHITTAHITGCNETSCASCHTNALPMNHPTGDRTPLAGDLSTPQGITAACSICHVTAGTSHPFRINLDTIIPNSYPDVDTVCGPCHGGSGTATPGIVPFTPGQLSVHATNIHFRIPRTANFTYALGTVSNQVDFDASGSACASAPCTYSWNFGDGTLTSAAATTSHIYPAGGSYLVIVIVTDSAGAQTMSPIQTVTFTSTNTPPNAAKLAPVVTGMTATVHDTSTDAEDAPGTMTATVICGNSTVVTGPDNTDLVCTYTTAGTYTIRHSVTDTGGLGSSSANVQVVIAGPTKTTVSGTIRKQDGTPIPYAILNLQVGGVTRYTTTAVATTGNFTFPTVLPGTYTVRAVRTGFTFTTPAQSVPSPIVVVSSPVAGVVVRSIE